MPPIEFAKLQNARHTVKVSLKIEENGASADQEVRVVYRGCTLEEADRQTTLFRDSDNQRETMIEQLSAKVIELPDIVENGAPVQPTPEFFRALDTRFLFRINKAVTDDQVGNA
jgi:hypothetical protein